MEPFLVIGGVIGAPLALILWAGRHDDTSESPLRNMWRGVYVIAGIVVLFGVIIWVGTYGN